MAYLSSFDPATLARIARLAMAAPIFAEEYTKAMAYAVSAVQREAIARAPVKSGTLRRGIVGYVLSPLQGVVGVGVEVPYARRRELGFSGMTDALGRFYPNDPGSFYLNNGLKAAEPQILAAFSTAAELAWRRIAI